MTLTVPPMLLSSLLFAVGEAAPLETNPFHYAVTQGGLLAVVLVLLYFQRQNEKDRAAKSQERTDSLMSILEKSSDAHVANALAVGRLADAIGELRAEMRK